MYHNAVVRPVTSVLCGYPAGTSPSNCRLLSVLYYGLSDDETVYGRIQFCKRLWRYLLELGCFHRPVRLISGSVRRATDAGGNGADVWYSVPHAGLLHVAEDVTIRPHCFPDLLRMDRTFKYSLTVLPRLLSIDL